MELELSDGQREIESLKTDLANAHVNTQAGHQPQIYLSLSLRLSVSLSVAHLTQLVV